MVAVMVNYSKVMGKLQDDGVMYSVTGGSSGGVLSENGHLGANDSLVVSGESSGEFHYWSWPTTIVLSIVLCILIVLAIGGNLLVISVVIRHKGMRTRTNMFLVNLSIADFLVGLLLMPMSLITIIKGNWIFNDVICTINGFLNALCLVASLQLLMYISIHKYFSIARPFSRFLTVRKILVMITAAWMWAVFCSIITVTGLQHVEYKPGTMQCGPSYPHDLLTYIHHGIIQVTDLFIPLGVMIFCYAKIFIEIRQHTQRMRANSTLERDTILAQQKKVTITLFIVLACFVICWLPYHAYASYVSYIKDKHTIPPIINALAYTFGYLNSACNPIIYALRSPSFREGYLEILCRRDVVVMSDEGVDPADRAPPIICIVPSQDDQGYTIQYGSPTSFKRRFSAFIGSMKHSIRRSRSGSEVNSNVPDSRRASCNSLNNGNLIGPREKKMSLTQLMRQSPKSPKGSSIIKSDGSVVVMKDGKIVCVRHQPEKRKISAPVFPTFKYSATVDGETILGNSGTGTVVEQIPLLENGHTRNLTPQDLPWHDAGESKLLQKIVALDPDLDPDLDEVFERSLDTSENLVAVDDSGMSRSSVRSDAEQGGYSDHSLMEDLELPASHVAFDHDTTGDESRSQPDIIIAITIDRGDVSPTPLHKSDDHLNFNFSQTIPPPEARLTKSDMFLDREKREAVSGSDPTLSAAKSRRDPAISRHTPLKHKSERGPRRRPGMTLRLPSVEHLDGLLRPRSNSDSRTQDKPNLVKSSPRAKRRSWFGTKRPRQQPTNTVKDEKVNPDTKTESKDELTHL